MSRFAIRPLAWREINAELDYLEEQAGLETTNRFLDRLIQSCELLAENPEVGSLCGFLRPSTIRIRRWPVKDFENWLIFYKRRRSGVEIVHVLHGARDLRAVIGGRTDRRSG